MISSKIAFLGAGNLAAAMIDGLLARGIAAPARIACLGGSGGSAGRLAARTGITLATSLDELLADAGTLVVAFKPQHLASADPRLAELTRGRLVVSVLAGKRLATLARVFPHARALVRAMPNTPAAIGAGITGWSSLRPLDDADHALATQLFTAMGRAVAVEERHLDAITALGGSGPAFYFEFVAALREAGIAAGLPADIAATFATETTHGAAQLLAQRQVEPEVLRTQVTSPNGTTFAGLQRLAAGDFRGLIRDTILAAKARAEALSQES